MVKGIEHFGCKFHYYKKLRLSYDVHNNERNNTNNNITDLYYGIAATIVNTIVESFRLLIKTQEFTYMH